MKLLLVDDARTISVATLDAIRMNLSGEVEIVDYKTKESVMHNRRLAIASALSALTAGLGQGIAALTDIAVANTNITSFAARYGNNPRSLNGSHRLNSNAAAQKRAAKKRRNVRAKSSKRA